MTETDHAAVRVGLLDTGVDDREVRVVARAAFRLKDGAVHRESTADDDTAHGNALARVITSRAPGAAMVIAGVFRGGKPGTAAVVASGLDWLVEQGVGVVNMSFGLLQDRAVLRAACEQALAGGAVLVASAPASGPEVFPAAYPGVVRVTGDARCAPGELSWLGDGRVDFGACVGGPDHRPHHPGAGASLAAAHFTGELANALAAGVTPGEAVEHLRRACRYRGRERRAGPPSDGPDPRP